MFASEDGRKRPDEAALRPGHAIDLSDSSAGLIAGVGAKDHFSI
jgi:hypothetical protein